MSRIEESVMAKIYERSLVGEQKYSVTMERTDLKDLDWLIHLQEEVMDSAVYLERIIQDKRKELGISNGN